MQNDMLDLQIFSSGNDNTRNINCLVVSNRCLNSARGDRNSQNMLCVCIQLNATMKAIFLQMTIQNICLCSVAKSSLVHRTFLFSQFRDSPHATFIIKLTAALFAHST